MIKRNASNKTAFVLAFTIIIVAILFICLNIINEPNKEQITDIIINNEITINSSNTDVETDCISIDEIKNVKIVESGYDFMEMKYFCLVDTSMYSKGHSLEAKLMLFMRYDKGWQLVDEIGVLEGGLHSKKIKMTK